MKKNAKKSFRNLKTLGLMVVMPTVLICCGTTSSVETRPLNIYQPSTLSIQKGTPIQTSKGAYTPQQDEIWHSDARFRKLERQLYYPADK